MAGFCLRTHHFVGAHKMVYPTRMSPIQGSRIAAPSTGIWRQPVGRNSRLDGGMPLISRVSR